MPEILAEVQESIDITATVAATPGSLTDDYNDLQNHPSINGVELVGDKTTNDLHIDHVPLADNLVATTGTTSTSPYTLRSAPSYAGSVAELRKIVGGTVAWNQQIPAKTNSTTAGGITFAGNSDGSITVSDTVSTLSSAFVNLNLTAGVWNIQPNHVYYVAFVGNASPWLYLRACYTQSGSTKTDTTITSNTSGTVFRFTGASDMAQSWFRLGCINTGTYDCTVWPMALDLTQMFGSTIADAIYTMETGTAGSGVAFFRSLFPSDYYPYSATTLASVQTSARKALDGNGNTVRTYPLDSDLTLNGIPDLDANNQLYYRGDTYDPLGNVTRHIRKIEIGSIAANRWTKSSANVFYFIISQITPTLRRMVEEDKSNSVRADGFASYAMNDRYLPNTETLRDGIVWASNTSNYVGFYSSAYASYTIDQFRTAMSGKYLYYLSDTPTTETADPYTEVQLAGETEQFVCDNYIPVGNETFYPTDLTGVVQNLAPLPTTAGTYKLQVTVSGGVPSYSWVAG